MSDLNIDDFCKDVAKSLSLLYKQFPQKITLYVEDISGPDTPDEFGLHSPRFLSTFHTLVWLSEHDYLNFSQAVKQEALEEVTLSHRSFLFLSGIDESHGNTSKLLTRISLLRETLRNKSSDQLKSLVLRYMHESRQYQ